MQHVGSEEKVSVSVMCSIDVLKMRSEYFYNLLCGQDCLTDCQPGLPSDPGDVNNVHSSRSPIIVNETSPFEAAAFFESLHEGDHE